MFKTHKIWFPPEFTLHLGNVPMLHSSLLSHPHGSHKRFFKPFIYAGVFVPICIPSELYSLPDFLPDKEMCVINLPSTDGFPPAISF